jgi:phage tail sheath protein FI
MTTYSRPGVYLNELPLAAGPINGAAAATSAGAVIAAFAQGPETVTKVTSWYDFSKRFGGYNKRYPSTFAVGSFFKSGGTELYVRRVLPANATKAEVDVPIDDVGAGTLVTLRAKNRGTDGNNIRVKFSPSNLVRQSGYWDLSVYLEGDTSSTTDDILVEQFNGIVFNDEFSSDYIVTILDYNSRYIEALDVDLEDVYGPVTTLLPLSGAETPEDALTYEDYTGDDTGTDGDAPENLVPDNAELLKEFDVIDQPLVVFAPDVNVNLSGWSNSKGVYNMLIAWAELGRHVVVVETVAGLTPVQAMTAANDLTESSRAAVYYPHYFIQDPLGKSGSSIRKVGPSGAVAGLYLSTDVKYGPFKTPAGIDTRVQDAIALERAFTPAELDQLNTGVSAAGTTLANVNAIRNVPGAGVVVMGGRTLLQDGTANRYINMRRSLIYIEKRLNDLAQFAVFENNNEVLWSRLVTVLGGFLNEYRNQGGLRGTTPDAAFYVKCDDENNTAATIAAGEVHVEIGVALEYPAEFVVINLSQKTAE